MDTAAVTGLDEKLDIGFHEWDSHRDIGTIREHKVGVLSKLLDDTKDVILLIVLLVLEFLGDIYIFIIDYILPTHRPQFNPELWFLNS